MTNEPNIDDEDAKRLEVALEVLRVMLLGDDPFHQLINANRSKDDQPADWTSGFEALFQKPIPTNTTPATPPPPRPATAPPRVPGGVKPEVVPYLMDLTLDDEQGHKTPDAPPQNANLPKPGPIPTQIPKYEVVPGPTSSVSAFDRPQPVIIMGPNPLPVKLIDEHIVPGKSASNTPRGRGREANGGGIGTIANALGRQFAALMGPLYAFGTILSQSNSGFNVFGKAIDLLGTTLAPLVLPAFVMLATGLLQVSDMIWSKLLPALGDFYQWMMDHGLPGVQNKVSDVEDAVDAGTAVKNLFTKGELPKLADLGRFGDSALRNIDPSGAVGFGIDNVGGFNDILGSMAKGRGSNSWAEWSGSAGYQSTGKLVGKAGESLGAGEGSSPAVAGKGPMSQKEALSMVMQSLQMSLGPKASYSGGAKEYAQGAQLAAIGGDPLQMKMLQVAQESLSQLQVISTGVNKEAPRPNEFRAERGK